MGPVWGRGGSAPRTIQGALACAHRAWAGMKLQCAKLHSLGRRPGAHTQALLSHRATPRLTRPLSLTGSYFQPPQQRKEDATDLASSGGLLCICILLRSSSDKERQAHRFLTVCQRVHMGKCTHALHGIRARPGPLPTDRNHPGAL